MPSIWIHLGSLFLLFHSAILKPNFYLPFRKTKTDCHFCSRWSTQVSEKGKKNKLFLLSKKLIIYRYLLVIILMLITDG